METENAPVTALEGLRLATPKIQAWHKDAKLMDIGRPSNLLSLDGKELDWSFLVYSLKANRTAFFHPYTDMTEDYPAGRFAKTQVDRYADLDHFNGLNLIDSNKFTQRLDALDVLDKRNNQLWVTIGATAWWPKKPDYPIWAAHYYNVKDKLAWQLYIDMQSGETLFHEADKIQPLIINLEKREFNR